MTFSLQFIDRQKRMARIRAGIFSEEFAVAGNSMTAAQEKGWRRELATLLGRKKKILLPVAGHRRSVSRGWVFYRVGESAFIQDRLFPVGFDPKKSRVPKRETTTREGHQISEWSVGISAIRDFLGKAPNKTPQRTAPSRRR